MAIFVAYTLEGKIGKRAEKKTFRQFWKKVPICLVEGDVTRNAEQPCISAQLWKTAKLFKPITLKKFPIA